MKTGSMETYSIRIDGIVEGVGFRPFVARTARKMGVAGWVRNGVDGVTISATVADKAALDAFVAALHDEAPAAARIIDLQIEPAAPEDADGFAIIVSSEEGAVSTLVSPDLATCPDCERELFDPENRRYHYPFINCTNCGPRFTIIEALPYDRENTSMADFEMCDACAREYADEDDRRYHAQPDACFTCGPHLWFSDGNTREVAQDREQSDALLEKAAGMLADGKVLAVKGLGGWHLACDATSEEAVATLRERKRRPSKPLAVMVSDLDAARKLCEIDETAAELLSGQVRPIVLAPLRDDAGLAAGVCDPLPDLGIMLPSTPVQHLLTRLAGRPLVMTSGNRSGEPIVADDDEALDTLAGIADAFLGNDRRIVARYDDSVVRASDPTPVPIRRARGLAPAPLFVPAVAGDEELPTILACGPEQKATLCLREGNRAYVSQHLGDLEHAGAFAAWEEALPRYRSLFDLDPQVVVCDMHPEYLSTKWAKDYAAAHDVELIEVQHHHAHIAAVMGEHGLDEPVVGVALDGTGYGTDGTIWGCEILQATRGDFTRLWHLPTFPLPGGAAAVLEPKRCGYSLLKTFGALDDPQFAPFLDSLTEREAYDQMIERGLNCPATSSLGRLFDGVSALLGLCEVSGYDGEAACLLEAAALREGADTLPATADADLLTPQRFHQRIADTIVRRCVEAADTTTITKVVLGGGCLVNRILLQLLEEGLEAAGLEVYTNKELPPNDACISYGQAIVAAARIQER